MRLRESLVLDKSFNTKDPATVPHPKNRKNKDDFYYTASKFSFILSLSTRKMMTWEFTHARDAIKSGLYVTLYNREREHECTRWGEKTKK
jgi:hypothetical protein